MGTAIKTILVTGGTGYIGSHIAIALIEAGYRVVLLDNFCNSNPRVLEQLEAITGTKIEFIRADLCDSDQIHAVLKARKYTAVIHLAGLKYVEESVQAPLLYYDNNVRGTITLLSAMDRADVRSLIFSSSATVYGRQERLPIKESYPCAALHPYGSSKLMVECLLSDIHTINPEWHIATLRYFNAIGAHTSGLIGEAPRGKPNSLMPSITRVALNAGSLSVFGGDYPTADGTATRDYIHVMDLAEGHIKALQYCLQQGGLIKLNLGAGRAVSVLEIIDAFERANGCAIPYKIIERRAGDVPELWADTSLAEAILGWNAKLSLEQMCEDSWRWQQNSKETGI